MQNKSNRIRAQSAKPYSQRSRPLVDKANKGIEKTGMIQKIYANFPNMQQRPSSSRQRTKLNSVYLANNINNVPGGTIQKQALFEQNLQLKKKIHGLEEELAQSYGKIEGWKSKNAKLRKNLNVEFENQNLWNGKNAYLVTGVKNQYQNLKTKYKQKCNELQAIKNTQVYTALKQIQKQNEVLRRQNTRLIQMLVKSQGRSNQFLQNSSQFVAQMPFQKHEQKALQMITQEFQYRLQQTREKLDKRTEQLSNLKQEVQVEQVKKIKFLEKLIIEMDNSVHALHLKNKKLEKEKSIIVDQIKAVNSKIQEVRDYYEDQMKSIKDAEEKKARIQKQIYSRSIQEKSFMIEKLQKEVAYLTTLLSYWKPLDQEDAQKKQSPLKSSKHPQANEPKPQQELKKQNIKLSQAFNILGKSFNPRMSSELFQTKKTEQAPVDQPRTQNRADKKRSQTAKKVRKVKKDEIQEIGQILRFRLIAQRVNMDEAKKFFDHQRNPSLSQQENQWQNEYISMKQASAILKSQPFFLMEDQANLVSRYLVEDVQSDYIYLDEQNQHKRSIIKSIFKNVVGDYSLNKSPEDIQKETEIQLGKYQSKISTILQQMYPGGLVSKKKLVQIFVGSGFEIDEDILDYIIGKIAMKSETLNTLTYKVLFSTN